MRTSLRALTALALGVPLVVASVAPSAMAAPSKRKSTDTTPPAVFVAAPTSGGSSSASFTASGSATDNKSLNGVYVALDGGAWQAAIGTTSWSLPFSNVTAGSHTLTAKAVDGAGNTAYASSSFSVATTSTSTTTTSPSPSPSPTASPSPSPSPTATSTTSPSPSTTTTTTSTAPSTQGSWTSPEGVKINVSTAGPFTIASVYSMLKANALNLDLLGPGYTVNVQDQYSSMTTTMVNQTNGVYGNYTATTYLKGVNSTFATWPDYVLAHEYGIAWSQYWMYMKHGGSWADYLGARWDTSDGSVALGQDSRLYSSLTWQPAEIIADDYRLLFGSSAAITERNYSVNTSIPDPRNQPGLGTWLLGTWA